MPQIFVSYRRTDGGVTARRVADRLEQEFGKPNVFIDVDSLDPGDVFPDRLTAALHNADACVVIIGPAWAETVDASGRRRLDDPDDYVRMEIRRSLERNIKIVPVLIDGASVPTPEQLPDDIDGLRFRQAVEIRSSTFVDDVGRLIAGLRSVTFLQLAIPTFVTVLAGAALGMAFRTVGLPPPGPAAAEAAQAAVRDPAREAVVLVVAAVISRTGIMAGIGVAAKKALGISTDKLLGTLGLLAAVAALTFSLDAYLRQPLYDLFDSTETAQMVRSFALAAMYYGLAIPVVIYGMSQWQKLGTRTTTALGLGVALGAGVAVAIAGAADLAIFRRLADVPFVRSMLSGTLEFPIRWATIGAVILACLHRRTGLSVRDEAGIVLRVLFFAFGARLASNAVMWMSRELSQWGVPLALSYAILVPLILRQLVHVFARTRETAGDARTEPRQQVALS